YIRNNFNNTPTMQSLMKRKGRYPAYISSASFVQALICEIDINKYTPELMKEALNDNTTFPKDFKQVLKNLWAQALNDPSGNPITAWEKRVEDFYNNSMDRATGWYKKKIRMILLALGLVLAFALDIDTIKIVEDALSNKDKLDKAVSNISASLPKLDSLQKTMVVTDTSIEVIKQSTQNNINMAVLKYEQTTGYGLGYSSFKEEWNGHFWKKILGLLITAFALQMGSNYWFDLMNKAVNIRATGKKPDDKPKDDTKTKTT
ncbi:MAG: hypothetical protein JO072_03575, partial [Parafilimonas sp.]|nr:hypothetical protein [Parafilimonas sp.]